MSDAGAPVPVVSKHTTEAATLLAPWTAEAPLAMVLAVGDALAARDAQIDRQTQALAALAELDGRILTEQADRIAALETQVAELEAKRAHDIAECLGVGAEYEARIVAYEAELAALRAPKEPGNG